MHMTFFDSEDWESSYDHFMVERHPTRTAPTRTSRERHPTIPTVTTAQDSAHKLTGGLGPPEMAAVIDKFKAFDQK